jgi:exopolysaccharide production protein ExoZ
MRPEVGQGWTLNYEVFFYFAFGLSLYLPRRYRMPSVATFLLVLTATGVLFRPSGAITSTYTDSLLLEFVLGIVLGYVLVRKLRTSMEAAALLSVMLAGVVSLGIEVFTTSPLPRVIEYGLPAAGLVAGALYLERAKRMPNVPALLLLGDASYSLYLLHGFLLAVLRRVWQQYFDINLVSTHVMFILVSTIAAGAVGIAAFRYVERPVTRRLTKALRKKGLLRDDGMRKETQLTSEPRQTVHAI